MGVEKSLEVIEGIKVLVTEGSDLLKNGISLSKLGKLISIVGLVQELVMDAKAALPELGDIDSMEAGKLTEASYKAVQEIVKAIAKK